MGGPHQHTEFTKKINQKQSHDSDSPHSQLVNIESEWNGGEDMPRKMCRVNLQVLWVQPHSQQAEWRLKGPVEWLLRWGYSGFPPKEIWRAEGRERYWSLGSEPTTKAKTETPAEQRRIPRTPSGGVSCGSANSATRQASRTSRRKLWVDPSS